MPLNLFYTMVQKSQKWPKTQIMGGSCLNVIHFFDEKKDGAAAEIRSFASVLRSPLTPFDRSKTKNANCFEERNGFGNGKCEMSAFRGRNLGANFWQGKVQNF